MTAGEQVGLKQRQPAEDKMGDLSSSPMLAGVELHTDL